MMVVNWNRLLNLKYVLAAILVTLLFSVVDFSQRVWIDSTDSVPTSTKQALDELQEIPSISKQQIESLITLYSKYDVEVQKLAAEQATKLADSGSIIRPDIGAQHGGLVDFYTETSQLRLKAVINQGHRFALVQQSALEGGEITWLKLKKGDTFDGFTVQELRHLSVVLVRGEQVVDLLMYKKKS